MKVTHSANPFLTHPRTTLSLVLVLCLPIFWRLAGFSINPDTRILLEGDQRNLSAFEKVSAILKRNTVVVISMESDRLFSRGGFRDLRELGDQLSRQPGLIEVKSLTHSVRPVRRGLSFEMVPLVPAGDLSDEEIAKIREFALTHPLVRNIMVAPDARHTLITGTYQRDVSTAELRRAFRQETEAILEPFRARGYRFRTLALPFVEDEIYSTLGTDLGVLAPLAGGALIVLLGLAFRSRRFLLLTLLNLLLVLALIPGLMSACGITLTLYTVMLFPLLGGVHLTLLIHIFLAFQWAEDQGHDLDAALGVALGWVFKSCLFAALTTAIGLLSLVACDVSQVRDFGVAGALGIVLVFAWSFGPGLALHKLFLRLLPEASRSVPRTVQRHDKGSWHDALVRLILRHRVVILTVGFLASVVAVWGLKSIRTDIRVVEFLNRASPTRQTLEEFDRIYGGINVVQIEVDSGRANGINDLPFLRYVERVQEFAAARSDVSGVYSYAQLLAMMNQIWEQGESNTLRLPGTPLLLNLFVGALNAGNYPFLRALADETGRKAFVIVRTRDMPSARYLQLVEEVLAFARSTQPKGVSVSATEGIHSILEADRRIRRAQVDTALLTLGAVWVALALLWRSAWFALLSILTNIIPVALVLGVAGFLDIPLNSITVMVAAIVLGIAVDDSVHFITWWRDEYRRSGNLSASLADTFRAKGGPIIWTSVILICVFAPFVTFSFPPLQHFGVLSAIAFAAALCSVVFFLPAALAGRKKK